MLAKRFIVIAFAAFVALATPLMLTGAQKDLFRDTPEALLTTAVASGPSLIATN
jgi:hypothetical protein